MSAAPRAQNVLRFGRRWTGHTVDHIAQTDPQYLRWLISVPSFKAHHPDAYAAVRAAVIRQLQDEAAIDALL